MGVIFQNGFGVGVVPNNFGGSGQWLLEIGNLGYAPAWDSGSITFPLHNANSGTNNPVDLLTNPGGLYINGQDSNGNDKSTLLQTMVNHSGTLTLTQGSTQVVFGFNTGSFYPNTWGYATGSYYDNAFGHSNGLTLVSSQNLPFNGYDGTGSINNSQLINVTINII